MFLQYHIWTGLQASDDQSSSMGNLLTYAFLLINIHHQLSYHCKFPAHILFHFFILVACNHKSLAKVVRG